MFSADTVTGVVQRQDQSGAHFTGFRGMLLFIVGLSAEPARTHNSDLNGEWLEGPLLLPISQEGSSPKSTDVSQRLTYFEGRVGESLYGMRSGWSRWHKIYVPEIRYGVFLIDAAERLCMPSDVGLNEIVVLHLKSDSMDSHVLKEWSDICRMRHSNQHPVELFGLCSLNESEYASLAYSVCLAKEPIAEIEISDVDSQTSASLFHLAAAVRLGEESSSKATLDELRSQQFEISNDWVNLTLRDGASFVGRRGSDWVGRFSEVYVRTIYLDCYVLGVLQMNWLNEIANRISQQANLKVSLRAVKKIEQQFNDYRNSLWWRHLTRRGNANVLIRRYQDQHQLEEMLEQLRTELDDYARQIQAQSEHNIQMLAGLFAMSGVLQLCFEFYVHVTDPEASGKNMLGLWLGSLTIVLGIFLIWLAATLQLRLRVRDRLAERRRIRRSATRGVRQTRES